MPHSFTTKRLLLRPMRLRDARAFQKIANHPEMTRNTAHWRYPFTAEYTRARWASYGMDKPDNGLFFFAVVHRGELAGFASLHGMENGRAELAYWIGRPFEGRGIGTEAARAVCAHGFRIFRLDRIHAEIFLDNPGSLKIAERLGFVMKGTHLDQVADRPAPALSGLFVLEREKFHP